MKTIVAKSGSEAQDAGAFVLKAQPIPEPGTQDLLVRVMAIGMNPVDTKVRKRSEEDRVLGWDAYGIVEKTGKGVTGFKPGDKVFYAGDITRPGTNSEFHLVDQRIAALAPKRLSPEDAVAMPMYTRSMFETDDMSEQGKLLSTVAGLLDEGALVTTRQKTLTGLTPENIQAMHIKQESGTMMGKQVLLLLRDYKSR